MDARTSAMIFYNKKNHQRMINAVLFLKMYILFLFPSIMIVIIFFNITSSGRCVRKKDTYPP